MAWKLIALGVLIAASITVNFIGDFSVKWIIGDQLYTDMGHNYTYRWNSGIFPYSRNDPLWIATSGWMIVFAFGFLMAALLIYVVIAWKYYKIGYSLKLRPLFTALMFCAAISALLTVICLILVEANASSYSNKDMFDCTVGISFYITVIGCVLTIAIFSATGFIRNWYCN